MSYHVLGVPGYLLGQLDHVGLVLHKRHVTGLDHGSTLSLKTTTTTQHKDIS